MKHLLLLAVLSVGCASGDDGLDGSESDVMQGKAIPTQAQVPNRLSCWTRPYDAKRVDVVCMFTGPNVQVEHLSLRLPANGTVLVPSDKGGGDVPHVKIGTTPLAVARVQREGFEVAVLGSGQCRHERLEAWQTCQTPVTSLSLEAPEVTGFYIVRRTGETSVVEDVE